MAKKITRSELNANFYGKIDDEISEIKQTTALNENKLLKIKKRLSLIDNEYFSQVIDEIEQTVGLQSLYLDNTLTDEEKFFSLKNALKDYLTEINSIVDQKIELVNNFETIFSLQDNQLASNVQTKLDELMDHLNQLPSLTEKNEQVLKDFERLYPGIQKNLIIIDDKFAHEKDGGIPYQERIVNAKAHNKTLITDIKRQLNHYKIKWLWYVIIAIVLILGMVLAILIPIFVI